MSDFGIEAIDHQQLERQLSDRRSLPRPSVTSALAYGRHRGPAPADCRIAAVAVTLYRQHDGQWTIPLTLRPQTLQHHGGQVCLPGGRVERDEDIFTAAMREFEEELGIAPEVLHRCGELSSQYVYASHNLVHPVVAFIRSPTQPWQPDPAEVDIVIPLPLDVLMDERCRTHLIRKHAVRVRDQKIDQFSFRATAIEFQGHKIWGATALILDQLAQILHRMD